MPWTAVVTSTFKRGYKKKTEDLKTKVDAGIKEIVLSHNPFILGKWKQGKLRNCLGYDIDSRNRILFQVDDASKTIYFLRVCDHTQVYGTS